MRIQRLWVVVVVAGCFGKPPSTPVATGARRSPVSARTCTPASIDRIWGDRAGHPNLLLANDELLEYVKFNITRRSLERGPTKVIPSGFVYGMEVVGGGGYIYWLKKTADDATTKSSSVEVWTASVAGEARPHAIPGEFPTPVELHSAPDGVFVETRTEVLHLDRDGTRTPAIGNHVDGVSVSGGYLYAALDDLVVRRRLTGGSLEVVARSSSQIGQLIALGDRVVWVHNSGNVETNRPGSETPVPLGDHGFGTRLAASRTHIYLAAGNVVYLVGADHMKPVAKARSTVRALAVHDTTAFALVDSSGLARLCLGDAIIVKTPTDTIDCPPNHTARSPRHNLQVCVDATGNSSDFYRSWHESGEIAAEHLPNGAYRRWWADGSLVEEGTYDSAGEKHGTWTEHGETGTEITEWDHGNVITKP